MTIESAGFFKKSDLNMKKLYENPCYVFINIAKEDVIRTSTLKPTSLLDYDENTVRDSIPWNS